jgi:hypothetical protein
MKPLIPTPQIRALRKKLSETKERLWNLLDEYYYLTNIEYSRIMYEYEMLFGELEEKIQEKNTLFKELEQKIGKLSSRKTSAYAYYNDENRKNDRNINQEQCSNLYDSKIPNCPVNEKYEIQQIYRQIVKKLHPDIVGNSIEYNRFWNNVQDSYKNADLLRLRLFYQTLVLDNQNKNSTNPYYEEEALETEIKDLENNIQKLTKRIEYLKQQEPFIFEKKMKDKFWVSIQKKKLQLKINQIDKKISYHKKILMQFNSFELTNEIDVVN